MNPEPDIDNQPEPEEYAEDPNPTDGQDSAGEELGEHADDAS